MSNTDKVISMSKAAPVLNASVDRIAWLIAIGELSSTRNPQNKNNKRLTRTFRDAEAMKRSHEREDVL